MHYSNSEFPWIHIETFDFDRGVPQTVVGALLVDLRDADFNDPTEQGNLKGRDGKDPDVVSHVMASRMTFTKLNQIAGQATALLDFNAASNFVLRILVGDHGDRPRAVVVGDALTEIFKGRGIPAEVEHHHLVPQEDRPVTQTGTADQAVMDDATREAVRAFYRLHQATAAAVADPFHSGAQETLSNAAHEANAAMGEAGLLNRPPHEVIALVRQEFPHYDPTGGLGCQKGDAR
ncbi:hypothetical protein ACFU7X_18350 [Streptomyces chartreusis]|uniref:RapZ C-terminal domain-containing protein n=1 Tax=Streptomyces chartreusis TaxID=1969 RepID=UPI00369B4DE2